jgi:hypothetical protein
MQVTQGIYEHYKSTPEDPKLFQVLMLSHHEITKEVLVHYQPLYYESRDGIYDDGITVWTRTITNFCEEVEHEGKKVPRFNRISDNSATNTSAG